jgi:hypothetical protein
MAAAALAHLVVAETVQSPVRVGAALRDAAT